MASFTDIVQKAFYLGVGIATYAGEKAGGKLLELREQAQELIDEMVARGEMTTEEARRWVEEMTDQAATSPPANPTLSEPRRIEILSEEDTDPEP